MRWQDDFSSLQFTEIQIDSTPSGEKQTIAQTAIRMLAINLNMKGL